LTVLLIATVVGLRRTPLWAGPSIGLLLGAAILLRPAFQLFIPFTAAAWLVRTRHEGWQRVILHLVGLGLGLGSILSPWIAINKQRYDRFTVAPGSGAFLWYGVQHAGLLKLDQCPDDQVIREAYKPYETTPLSDGEFRAYCRATDGMGRREPLLRQWAVRSILQDLPAYLRWLAKGLKWQMNLYPPDMLDETAWFFRHAAQDDSAVCYTIDAPQAKPLVSGNRVGFLGHVLRRWADRPVPWFPTLPLFAIALLTIAWSIKARRWDLALMFGATVIYVLFHAALLSIPSRYTLPMATAWYAAVAIVPALVRGTLRTPQTPNAGQTDNGATCGGDL
jgi:4-amino-4-deoxy-L-arabinose transferase-like glycosyltransferase